MTSCSVVSPTFSLLTFAELKSVPLLVLAHPTLRVTQARTRAIYLNVIMLVFNVFVFLIVVCLPSRAMLFAIGGVLELAAGISETPGWWRPADIILACGARLRRRSWQPTELNLTHSFWLDKLFS